LAELLLYGVTLAIAAYGVIWTLLMFFNMPISGCHAGAKRKEEVIQVLKASLLVVLFPDVFVLGNAGGRNSLFPGKAVPTLLLWIIGRQFVFLVPLSLLLGNYLGVQGIYLVFPIAGFLSALMILYLVFRHLHRGSYSTT
jgi:Na+-driven multidrug efflux pump